MIGLRLDARDGVDRIESVHHASEYGEFLDAWKLVFVDQTHEELRGTGRRIATRQREGDIVKREGRLPRRFRGDRIARGILESQFSVLAFEAASLNNERLRHVDHAMEEHVDIEPRVHVEEEVRGVKGRLLSVQLDGERAQRGLQDHARRLRRDRHHLQLALDVHRRSAIRGNRHCHLETKRLVGLRRDRRVLCGCVVECRGTLQDGPQESQSFRLSFYGDAQIDRIARCRQAGIGHRDSRLHVHVDGIAGRKTAGIGDGHFERIQSECRKWRCRQYIARGVIQVEFGGSVD